MTTYFLVKSPSGWHLVMGEEPASDGKGLFQWVVRAFAPEEQKKAINKTAELNNERACDAPKPREEGWGLDAAD